MVSKKEEKYIANASHYASMSPMQNHHGCIVVLNGREIGKGYNHYRNYSRDKMMIDCLSCHAEICAVRNAIKMENNNSKKNSILKKIKLYVVRMSKGKYMDSKPCKDCHHQLRCLGVRNVIYSTGNDFVNMDLRSETNVAQSTGYRYISNPFNMTNNFSSWKK
jgi:deoxycytidylate deaminase